jgi:two-component system sensor histidine kinase HydH
VDNGYLKMELFPTKRNPWLIAGAFAAGYLVVCEAYIWISDEVARRLAGSMEEMTRIAQLKGAIFVFATALLIFAAIGWLLQRIARHEQAAYCQREAMLLSEQRAMAGVFAASIAHDMNNLLVILRGEVALLQGGITPTSEGVKHLDLAGQSLLALARRLMDLGRNAVGTAVEAVDLSRECRELVGLARKHQRVGECTLETEVTPGLHLRAKAVLLRQALLNLLLNAADATGGTGRILMRVFPKDEAACIEVHDNGPGIPDGVRERLFTPFYTTKARGSGLGLLSVKMCVEEHGGTVTVETSSILKGACFRLLLPLVSPAAAGSLP